MNLQETSTNELVELVRQQAESWHKPDAAIWKELLTRYRWKGCPKEDRNLIGKLDLILRPLNGGRTMFPPGLIIPGGGIPLPPPYYRNKVSLSQVLNQAPVENAKDSPQRRPITMNVPHPTPNATNRVFVASSKEAKALAKALIRDLANPLVEFVPWWEFVRPGRLFLSELEEVAASVTAALFVATPDISGTFRRKRVKLPNQNVLFELGYFFTVVKAERIAIIRYGDVLLPSDLLGYTHITGSKFFKAGASLTTGKATKAAFSKWVTALRVEDSSARAKDTLSPLDAVTGAVQSGTKAARLKAQEINCINNLKQVGLGARLWAIQHGGTLPPDFASMKGELGNNKITYCPSESAVRYEILSPGVADTDPSVIYARCPIHKISVLADGSVQRGLVEGLKYHYDTARATAQANTCINNLRQIDGAIQQWALESRKSDEAIPGEQEIVAYCKGDVLPKCPSGGKYKINAVKETPTCSVPGHALQHQL
jgi:predicted nucleotide-binding protein